MVTTKVMGKERVPYGSGSPGDPEIMVKAEGRGGRELFQLPSHGNWRLAAMSQKWGC